VNHPLISLTLERPILALTSSFDHTPCIILLATSQLLHWKERMLATKLLPGQDNSAGQYPSQEPPGLWFLVG
jgi:hypothetical protein